MQIATTFSFNLLCHIPFLFVTDFQSIAYMYVTEDEGLAWKIRASQASRRRLPINHVRALY